LFNFNRWNHVKIIKIYLESTFFFIKKISISKLSKNVPRILQFERNRRFVIFILNVISDPRHRFQNGEVYFLHVMREYKGYLISTLIMRTVRGNTIQSWKHKFSYEYKVIWRVFKRDRDGGNARDVDRQEKPKKRKSLDNDRAHPSIIPTRVFMVAGLAYTISNPISMRPIGKTLPCYRPHWWFVFVRATLNVLKYVEPIPRRTHLRDLLDFYDRFGF